MAINAAVGERITAAKFNGLVPIFLQQASDQILNTVTFTNHSTFAGIALNSGEFWEVSLNLVIGDSAVASDIKTQWALAGGAVMGYRHIISMGVTSTVANDMSNVNLQARTSSTTVSHGVTASSSVFATLQEKSIVGGPGTLTLQWACVAASGNVIVKAGSHLIAHRYA